MTTPKPCGQSCHRFHCCARAFCRSLISFQSVADSSASNGSVTVQIVRGQHLAWPSLWSTVKLHKDSDCSYASSLMVWLSAASMVSGLCFVTSSCSPLSLSTLMEGLLAYMGNIASANGYTSVTNRHMSRDTAAGGLSLSPSCMLLS